RRLGERAQSLIDKMRRLAQEHNARDPETAKMLEQAAELGNKEMLPKEIKNTAEQLSPEKRDGKEQQPSFHRATNQQANSIKTMQQMREKMEEKREAELDRLIKKQKELQKDLEKLADRMEKLQKKARAARNLKDADERKRELQRLADEQRKLEEEV